MPDLSRVFNLHRWLRQCWILHPLSEARDWSCNLMGSQSDSLLLHHNRTLIREIKSKLQWGTTSHHSEWSSLISLQIKNAGGCGEKGTLLHCWWEYKLVQPLWKIVWRYLRKLNIELPYDLAIWLLGIHLDKTFIQKYTACWSFRRGSVVNESN